MKAVILAGGLGSRLSEETNSRPKPMVEIGGKPIIWHIMKIYSTYGVNDFIICLGYKGYAIKEYFANYHLHTSDVTLDLKNNRTIVHNSYTEPWKITLVDTGDTSMTGARIRKIYNYVKNDDAFCLTYGDGVANVDIAESITFHHLHGKFATITAVQPPGRFGAIKLEGDKVIKFEEKPSGDGVFINGGFFVLSPKIINYISENDQEIWEQTPLTALAQDDQLRAYKHNGFWQPMDTLRDKNYLQDLWHSSNPPWKTW